MESNSVLALLDYCREAFRFEDMAEIVHKTALHVHETYGDRVFIQAEELNEMINAFIADATVQHLRTYDPKRFDTLRANIVREQVGIMNPFGHAIGYVLQESMVVEIIFTALTKLSGREPGQQLPRA